MKRLIVWMGLAALQSGCALEPRYIAGDPVHEAIRKQQWPKCKPAAYPLNSIINEEQGIVVLDVRISIDGKPVEAKVAQSSGFIALDAATLEHVHRCQFEPKAQDGKPVEYMTKFSFHWEMW